MLIQIFLFFAGITSGFAGGTTGGGGALIALPALVFAGLPMSFVIPTAKFSALGNALSTSFVFIKEKKINYRVLLPFVFVNVIEGYIGANLLVSIEQRYLESFIAALLAITSVFFLRNNSGVFHISKNKVQLGIGWLFVSIISVYDACFGLGGGIFMMMGITYFFGFTTLEANGITRLPWLSNLIIALVIFYSNQSICFAYALPLLVGRFFGGWWGAKIAIRKGNRFVKTALALLSMITAVKLLFF